MARAFEHNKLVAEQDSAYEAATLTDRGPGFVVVLPSGPSTPTRTALPASSSPPAAPPTAPRPPVPGRAIRRLDLQVQMESALALESTQPVDEADADCPASPDSCCSQRRLQEYEDQIKFSTYPAPPDAPRKDQYYSESDSEVETVPTRRRAGSPWHGLSDPGGGVTVPA